MKTLVGLLGIVLCCLVLTACDDYSEGDMTAGNTWPLMTVQEMQYYNAVQSVWGQSYLANLRSAIRNRTDKPKEDEIPFIDLGPIIKTTEEIEMVTKDNWKSDHIKKANNARFSTIDPQWYKLITKSEPPVYPDPVEEEESLERDTGDDEIKNSRIQMPRKASYESQNKRQMDLTDFVSADVYDDIKFDIRSCPEAKTFFNQIVLNEGRPLTVEDCRIIRQHVLLCKAKEISESMKE